MGFVQIIEFRTSKADEMKALGDEWEKAAQGDSTARRRVLCQDRDNPGRYFNLVFFDSYDDAMKNSELPVTGEFAARMSQLVDGDMSFVNLDVVEDRSL